MIKMGFEFAVGVIVAYEIYEFVKYIILKICDKIVERGKKYILDNRSIFSEDDIKRFRKLMPDDKPICKTRPIGFTADFDE